MTPPKTAERVLAALLNWSSPQSNECFRRLHMNSDPPTPPPRALGVLGTPLSTHQLGRHLHSVIRPVRMALYGVYDRAGLVDRVNGFIARASVGA